jgi:dTDP-4-amino-4,6-dideoxygalactose transaminase
MAPFAAGAQLSVTDALAAENLALPISPVLEPAQSRQVIAAVAGLPAT